MEDFRDVLKKYKVENFCDNKNLINENKKGLKEVDKGAFNLCKDGDKYNFGLHLNKCAQNIVGKQAGYRSDNNKMVEKNSYIDDIYKQLGGEEYLNKSKHIIRVSENMINEMEDIQGIEKIELEVELLENMAIGLGEASVNELSMKLHHTYGIPYIPGSAIKGVLSEYWDYSESDLLENMVSHINSININQEKMVNQKQIQELVFGTQDRQGIVLFMDSFPSKRKFEVVKDIMNPHLKEYYQGNNVPPVFEKAIPLFFNAIKKDTKFKIYMLIDKIRVFKFLNSLDDDKFNQNNKQGKDYKNVINQIKDNLLESLKLALNQYGLGAKVNVGYGTFKIDKKDNVSQSSKYEEMNLKLNMINEMSSKGANSRTEFRIPEYKSSLRFWWRYLIGANEYKDTKGLLKKEGELFGNSTDTESPIKINMVDNKFNKGPINLILSVKHKRGIGLSNEKLYSLIQLASILGGLGAASSKGNGSYKLQYIPQKNDNEELGHEHKDISQKLEYDNKDIDEKIKYALEKFNVNNIKVINHDSNRSENENENDEDSNDENLKINELNESNESDDKIIKIQKIFILENKKQSINKNNKTNKSDAYNSIIDRFYKVNKPKYGVEKYYKKYDLGQRLYVSFCASSTEGYVSVVSLFNKPYRDIGVKWKIRDIKQKHLNKPLNLIYKEIYHNYHNYDYEKILIQKNEEIYISDEVKLSFKEKCRIKTCLEIFIKLNSLSNSNMNKLSQEVEKYLKSIKLDKYEKKEGNYLFYNLKLILKRIDFKDGNSKFKVKIQNKEYSKYAKK